MKPRIFLGSSAEAVQQNVLSYVQSKLATIADCRPWIFDEVFGPDNTSTFDTLRREALAADFAVFIATADDLVSTRQDVLVAARDNVLFEFGLFLGVLGKNKVFLLVEEGVTLPSDLKGINVASFNKSNTMAYNSLEKKCQTIINTVARNGELNDLGWLPSTALAIGYFNGFVKQVCQGLHSVNPIVIGDKEYEDFKFSILIPSELPTDILSTRNVHSKKNGLISTTIKPNGVGRDFPLFINQVINDSPDLLLYDVPTTLNTLTESIMILLGETAFSKSRERAHIEQRELNNFAQVLAELISRDSCSNNSVVIQRISI